MIQPDKNNLTYAAIHSRRLILQLLRNGPLSRRQLMDLTGLRGSTITYIVRDLLEGNIIRTVGKRESNTVGKKQILLEVNPQLGWVAGFGISDDWGFLTYLDMAGNVLDRDHFEIDTDLPKILDVFAERVGAWSSVHSKKKFGRMLGVGVGTPGVVNADTGEIKLSTMLQVKNCPMRDMVAKRFGGARVCIDNNVNYAAQAEARLGSAAGLRNFIYFHINVSSAGGSYRFKSIGSTHCLDGKPYRGAHYSAGEIDRLLQGMVPVNDFSASDLLVLGEAEGKANDGLKKLITGMAWTLATICDLSDPQAVILGSNLPFCNKELIDLLQTELNNNLVPVPDRYIPVNASEFSDHGVAIGSALAVLDHAVSNLEDGVLAGLGNGNGS